MKTIYTILFLIILSKTLNAFTLLLDPAGDIKHAGRSIDDWFETGITMQFAEALKKKLETLDPRLSVILSHNTSESIEPLHTANFANRLAVDFCMSIHCYEDKENPLTLWLYQFTYDPITDQPAPAIDKLTFIPYDQAYRFSVKKTNSILEQIKNTLNNENYFFKIHGVFTLPFKPLIGIKTPACGIEISLKKKSDWSIYVDSLAHAFYTVINHTPL